MALTPIDVELLEDGADDAYGLWEVVWGLRTRYPQDSDEDLIAMSQTIVRDLLARRLISLLRADRSHPGQTRFEPVQADAIQPSVWDPRYWLPSEEPGALDIWYHTTDEGKRIVGDHLMRTGGDRLVSPD